jgi:hypothetical protein
MTSPETNQKFILDATAGFRMMWFEKEQPNTLYLDQRPECQPNIVADFRDLKQFPDKRFKLIVFDPPHFIKEDDEATTVMVRRFGMLKRETWQSDLQKGFRELFRILEDKGVLIFKWSNHQVSSHELLKLAGYKPLFYQISMSRKRKGSKSGSDEVQTLWFCFMKIPEMVVS